MDGVVRGSFVEVVGVLTVGFGDDGCGGVQRDDRGDSRMDGRNKWDVVGGGKVGCEWHNKGKMAKFAVAASRGDGDGVRVEFLVEE